MKILCVVAHPDDESFFAGGTLARHAFNGDTVKVIALSDGVRSRPEADYRDELERRDHFVEACEHLGAAHELIKLFPDQMADAVPQLTLNREVAGLVHGEAPDVVYTHHVGDLNLDHRRVAEAVLVATRQGPKVRCMTPEYPSRCVGPKFTPTLKVNAGAVARAAKLRACLCYMAELRDYPHPRSERAIMESPNEQFMEIR